MNPNPRSRTIFLIVPSMFHLDGREEGMRDWSSGRMRSSPRLKNPFSRRVRLYQRGVPLSIGMLFSRLLARFDKALVAEFFR
jgi:hypothetical protein